MKKQFLFSALLFLITVFVALATLYFVGRSTDVAKAGAPKTPTADVKANGSDGPITITYNTAATISWTSSNVTSCSESPDFWSGTSGSQSSGNLISAKTFTVSCTGPNGNVSDSVTVNVTGAPVPSVDIKANGADGTVVIPYNTSVTISWTSANVSTCLVLPYYWYARSGSYSIGPLTTIHSYTVNCNGPNGGVTDTVTVDASWTGGYNQACPDQVNVISGEVGEATVYLNGFNGCVRGKIDTTQAPFAPTGLNFSNTNLGNDYCSNDSSVSIDATSNYDATNFPDPNSGTAITSPLPLVLPVTTWDDSGTGCVQIHDTVSVVVYPPLSYDGSPDYIDTNTDSPASPDNFSLDCLPATVTIPAGSSTSYNLSTTAISGFNKNVTFNHSVYSVHGLRPYITVTYGNNHATPDSVTTANITTTSSTPNGTYYLTYVGNGGGHSHSCTVELIIGPGSSASITANGSSGSISIPNNTSATLAWTSAGTTSCTVNPGGFTGTSGSQSTGNLTSTTTYNLSCNTGSGTISSSVTVNVGAASPPVPDIKANSSDGPINISANSAATLSWTSTNASSCTVTSSPSGFNSSGTSGSGVSSGNLSANTIFTLTCTGPGGSASDSVTVQVTSSPPASPITVSASNTQCSTIRLDWSDGSSGNAASFRIYRRANTTDSWQLINEVPASQLTYTDLTPLGGSNYYAVSAVSSPPSSLESGLVTAYPGPIVPTACSANISTSDNDIISVQRGGSILSTTGTPVQDCSAQSEPFQLPGNGLFRDNDVVTFKVNVCNSGNQTLTNVSVVDTLANLSNPTGYTFVPAGCASNPAVSANTLTFQLSDLPASSVCSISFKATVTEPNAPAALYRFQNTAQINSDQATLTVYTPPYLFQFGSVGPIRRETPQ